MVEGGIYTGVGALSSSVALFLVQLIVIVGLTRIMSRAFSFLRQPLVIWEIIGGICLGPTVFGNIPGFSSTIFPTSSQSILQVVSTVGLVLYLFLVGMEIELGEMVNSFRRSATISLTGMIVPFGLGTACSSYMYTNLLRNDAVVFSSFCVFLGVAMSITAFPVLARILVDQKLLTTKVGVITISAAAVDDVIAWSLLALVICLLSAGKDKLAALWVFLTLTGFALFLLLVFKRFYAKFVTFMTKKESRKGLLLAATFCFIFVSAYFTEMLGVHAVFGGFLMGLCMPHGTDFTIKLTQKIEDFNGTVWLPLYFAFSGLRTNIKSLDTAQSWASFIMVMAAATAGKFGGCTLASRLQKVSWRESATVGVLMNTKGLVELIVLNLGLDVGVINVRIFTVMVLMAITTTVITTPVVNKIYPLQFRTEYVADKEKADKELDSIHDEDAETPAVKKELRHSFNNTSGGPSRIALSSGEHDHSLMRICIPFHSSDEAAVIASIMGLFGSSLVSTKIGALRLLELSDSYLRDNLLSMNRTEEESHEQSIKFDSVLRMVALFSRLVPSVEVRCGVRISHASDFGQDVSEFSRKFESDLVVLPLYRDKDSTLIASDLNGADYTQFVLDITNHCKRLVGLFLDGKTKLAKGSPGKILRQRICIVFRKEEDGFELLSLAKHFAGKPHTQVDVLLVDDSKHGTPDNAALAQENDANSNALRGAIERVQRAVRGEGSDVSFHNMQETEDFKHVSEFLGSESEAHAFSLLVVGGDSTLPLGFVSTSSLFGSLGSKLIEDPKIDCAVLTVLPAREEHVTTQSKSALPNFLVGGIIPPDSVEITSTTTPRAGGGDVGGMTFGANLRTSGHQQFNDDNKD